MTKVLSHRPSIAALLTFALLALTAFIQPAFADTTSTLLPTADGAYTAWTPSTGTSHFSLVNEASCNGATNYVSTTVVGNKDAYSVSLAGVPTGATITRIDITPCASNNTSGSGGSTLNVFYRANGADSSVAGAYALTGTTPTALASTAFTGLSIVKTATSTLQIGEVLSAGTKGARVSRIAATVTYTPVTPVTTTNAASSVGTTTATLNGAANPNSATTTGWFRYATTTPGTCTDAFGTKVGGSNIGAGTTSVNFAQGLSGLALSTTYYYCAIAANSGGTTTGSVVSFITN